MQISDSNSERAVPTSVHGWLHINFHISPFEPQHERSRVDHRFDQRRHDGQQKEGLGLESELRSEIMMAINSNHRTVLHLWPINHFRHLSFSLLLTTKPIQILGSVSLSLSRGQRHGRGGIQWWNETWGKDTNRQKEPGQASTRNLYSCI